MISQEKRMTLTHLQKLPKNVTDLGKLIAAKGFKKLPKVQKIAQTGHAGHTQHWNRITCKPHSHWLCSTWWALALHNI